MQALYKFLQNLQQTSHAMNSLQLEKILSKNRFTKRHFIGVFASDQLHTIRGKNHRYPYCFVSNTKPQHNIGEHWQCCWVPNKRQAEHFCSLGQPPCPEMREYLRQFERVQTNEGRQIQSDTQQTCGQYCIYFLISRASGQSYQQVLDTLWRTRAMADELVKFFVRRLATTASL